MESDIFRNQRDQLGSVVTTSSRRDGRERDTEIGIDQGMHLVAVVPLLAAFFGSGCILGSPGRFGIADLAFFAASFSIRVAVRRDGG